MTKVLITFLITLNSIFLFGNDIKLEKARQKYNTHKSIAYKTIAQYPNPETEEVTSFDIFYIVNNHKTKNFEFYSKTENSEEFYEKGDYSNVNNLEKSIYKYEKRKNQTNAIQNSRLVQYGPTFLLKYNWKYEDEIKVNEEIQSHYSFLAETHQFEGKTIKAEFHIYINKIYSISKFERKSYVDNKLGQTITFEFSNYEFSKNLIKLKSTLPKNFALKYYERSEINPLKKGTKAPTFSVKDITNIEFSSKNFIGHKTLFLFSSTSCGASKIVFDYINSGDFKIPNDLKFVNAYGSDKKESVEKYFKSKTTNFPIIVAQKEIEIKYQISGYPVLYLISENGEIVEVYDGYVEIIKFLKSTSQK
jgi:hypothetical protein